MKLFIPVCLFSIGCVSTAPAPAKVRVGEDACAHCRMTLVSVRTAAQIVAPGEEAVIFDELGCLRDYLAGHARPDGARIYVADHRTGAWLEAASATFTHTSITTPMASGLIAHADAASRDADPDAHGGTPVAAASILMNRQVAQ
jgi:copper chaperone NosL